MGSADSRLSTENSSNRQAAMDTSTPVSILADRVDQTRAFRNTTSFSKGPKDSSGLAVSTVNKNNAVHKSNTTQFKSLPCNNACTAISYSNDSMKNQETSVSSVSASSHPDFLLRDSDYDFQVQFEPKFSVASSLIPTEETSIESKDLKNVPKCKHFDTCVCMPQTPFICSFCHLIICKTCSEVAGEISLDGSQDINSTSDGVSEFSVPGRSSSDLCFQGTMGLKKNEMSCDEHVIEAMEYLACSKKLLFSSAPAHLQVKLKNILKNLQQMVISSYAHKQTQTCMNETDTRNVNKSRTLPSSVCEDKGGPEDIKSLSLVEKTEVEEVDCNVDNDTELICGTCDDTIILYSNDIDLSFKLHCQEARHLLAVGMKETDNVPQTVTERNSQSLTKYSNTPENAKSADGVIQLSDSKLEEFRKQLSDKGQLDFLQIIVRKITYKFVCTICDTILYDLDSTKAHMKGLSHKSKLGKLTGTKVKDTKVTENKYSYSCEICKEEFELQTSLEKHMKVHDKIKIVCQICKKSFLSRAALFQHSKDAHQEAINHKNQEKKLTKEKNKPSKDLGPKQNSEERVALNPLIPSVRESNLKSNQHSTSSNWTQDVPLTPSKIDGCQKITTSDGSKSLESKWIRVTGKGSFSVDSIFNTFSTFGVIHKIIVLKAEARVLFQDILVAAHVMEARESLRLHSKKVLVSILSEAESKKIHGAIGHVDLTLPNEAAQVIKSEKLFVNTCSRLLEEASRAEKDLVKVQYLCNLLESLLKMVFPKCRAYEFGSRALGLANMNSDVDIFFDIGSNYFGKDASVAQKDICSIVYQALMASNECRKIEKVSGARVPIVKFVHRKMNLACDVSFRCGLGHRNTMLLGHFLGLNKWLRPLILVTKEWLRLSKIKPGKRGMTSYTLVLMIIFYLQSLTPPLLPSVLNLQELTDESKKVFVEDWDCSIPSIQTTFTYNHANQNSTQELLKGFFLFYGNFDFQEYVVCPLLGRTLKRSLFSSASVEECSNLPSRLSMYLKSSRKNQAPIFQVSKPMCVQDPFELSHNVAKGVPEILMVKFQANCLSSHKRLTLWDLTPNSNLCNPPSLLKSRLPVE